MCATETAENIAYSCNMLREEMDEVFVVSAHTPEDVRQELRSEEVISQLNFHTFPQCVPSFGDSM